MKWRIGQETPEEVLQRIRALVDPTGQSLVVCFDYFDTIVTRRVEPENTKRLAAILLSRLLRGRFQAETLYNFRRDIEYRLCLANAARCGEHEFVFADLSHGLWQELQRHDGGDLPDSERFFQDMLAVEVAVEKAVQQVCPEVLQLLNGLQRLGIRLLLVSDFYLPESAFKELLAWHRLDHFFSRIYVSACEGRSKGSGKIYPKICEDCGIASGQLLMIGDNSHADIAMSRQNGLRAIHLQRPNCKTTGHVWQTGDILPEGGGTLFQQIPLPESRFPEIGLSFWLFIHRLFDELNNSRVHNVFFLSKEGELLKKLFDQYQLSLFGSIHIRSHYLLASRRSTFVASLRPLAEENFARLLDHYRDISIREFLQSLNLETGAIDNLCQKLEVDCDQRVQELRYSRLFQMLLDMEEFRDVFEARRQEQKKHFINYLDSFGVNYRREGLHLVDVGWKGSIQDNIYFIHSEKVRVSGYFLGSLNATERNERNRKIGLLFDNHPSPSRFLHIYNSNRSLFEMILGASHGSAGSYRPAMIPVPADAPAAAGNDGTPPGYCHPCVVIEEVPEERQLFQEYIKPLQEKILSLNLAMNRAYVSHGSRPADDWFARHHARMVFLPTSSELELFEKLYHYENFGIFEFTGFKTSHDFSWLERLKHLKNIIKDPAILESGVWPPIILRRFGVGFWQKADGLRRYYRELGSWPPFQKNRPGSFAK